MLIIKIALYKLVSKKNVSLMCTAHLKSNKTKSLIENKI